VRGKAMLYKVAFIGDSGVGKTSLIKAFLGEDIKKVSTTIGVDFYHIRKQGCEIVVWDFAGQKWFREIIIDFLKGAALVVMVFDLSRPSTLINLLKSWLHYVLSISGDKTMVIVVGNKKDIKTIPDEFIEEILYQISQKVNFKMYLQTSALLKENVSNLFQAIFEVVKLLHVIMNEKGKEEINVPSRNF